MEVIHVTLSLNPSPRERDYVASLRSMCLFVVYCCIVCLFCEACAGIWKYVFVRCFFYEGVDFQAVGLDACVLWGAGVGCKSLKINAKAGAMPMLLRGRQ